MTPESLEDVSNLFTSKTIGEGNTKALALVAGFDAKIEHFEDTARMFAETGRDVVVYEHAHDILLEGDPYLLPQVIGAMSAHFLKETADHESHQYAGASIGSAIAWNMQKVSPNARPGMYAAAGADPAPAVLQGIFRHVARYYQKIDPAKSYAAHGYSVEDVAEVWEPLVQPPKTGFVVALGALDPIMKIHEVVPRFRNWQRATPIEMKIFPYKGHDGIIKWFKQNPLHMLQASLRLERDQAQARTHAHRDAATIQPVTQVISSDFRKA